MENIFITVRNYLHFIIYPALFLENIKIRFYELDDEDRVVWQDWGQFNDLDVHHQYAIVFK